MLIPNGGSAFGSAADAGAGMTEMRRSATIAMPDQRATRVAEVFAFVRGLRDTNITVHQAGEPSVSYSVYLIVAVVRTNVQVTDVATCNTAGRWTTIHIKVKRRPAEQPTPPTRPETTNQPNHQAPLRPLNENPFQSKPANQTGLSEGDVKELRVKIDVSYHLKLHALKLLRNKKMSDAIEEALDYYFEHVVNEDIPQNENPRLF